MKKIFICVMLSLLLPFSIMLTGCFGDNKYNITLEQINNVDIYCDTQEAKEGEEITLYYDDVETGYEFLYFTLNGEQLDGDIFTMPSKDVTISAVVSKIQYTITYHIDSDTTFRDNATPPSTYTIGSVIEIPDAVKSGTVFEGWYSDSNFENEVDIIWAGMYGNLNLYPKFFTVSYSIIYHNVGNGSHTNPTSYNNSTGTITLSNAEKQDYEFKGWYDNENFTGNKITTIPAGSTGKINLYAKFISTKVDNEGYRLITSAIDFVEIIKTDLNGKYKLTSHIDLSDYDYTPIGNQNNPFTGELNGDGNVISDVNINEIGTHWFIWLR